MTVIDHKAQAQSRVYAQYKNKLKIMGWIAINGDLGNEIETAYQDIVLNYDIDNANTNELDILGRIVVINRSFEAAVDTHSYLFGSSAQFGSAQFRPAAGVTNQPLNDDVYRLLIKAKIAKNNNDATLDGIINAIGFMVETTGIQISDPEDMSFSITFDILTDLEKLVLSTFNIVPKPQGVRFSGFTELAGVTQFGRQQFGSSQFAYRFGA
jgi:hypothetical protein